MGIQRLTARWRRALRLLVACAVIAGPSQSVAGADPALLARAAEMAEICADHMPNSKAAGAAFVAAGFRYESSDGYFHYYSLNGRRIVASTTTTSARRQGCLIVVSKMTPAEAETLIAPWVALANAKPVEGIHRDFHKSWLGTFRGGPVGLAVIRKFNSRFVRGAAIFAVEPR